MFTFMSGLNKHKKLGRCKGPQNEKAKYTPEQVARIAKEQLDEITVNPKKAEKEENIFSDLLVPEHVETVKIKRKRARQLPVKDACPETKEEEFEENFTIASFVKKKK
jgi:hypothetical protein